MPAVMRLTKAAGTARHAPGIGKKRIPASTAFEGIAPCRFAENQITYKRLSHCS